MSMPIDNLIENSNNYSDRSGSFWQFQRDETVPLKYLCNFWRSIEMPLINYKVHLQLNWIENCILSSVGNSATFKIITNTKLYVTIVTLSTKDNAKLAEHISYRFKHCVYGKEYRNKSEKVIYRESNIDI